MYINDLNDKFTGMTISRVFLSHRCIVGDIVFSGTKEGKKVEIFVTPRDYGLYVDAVTRLPIDEDKTIKYPEEVRQEHIKRLVGAAKLMNEKDTPTEDRVVYYFGERSCEYNAEGKRIFIDQRLQPHNALDHE